MPTDLQKRRIIRLSGIDTAKMANDTRFEETFPVYITSTTMLGTAGGAGDTILKAEYFNMPTYFTKD